MLGSQSRGRLPYSSVKLLSDYIKVNVITIYQHYRQIYGETDRQTDRQQIIAIRRNALLDVPRA